MVVGDARISRSAHRWWLLAASLVSIVAARGAAAQDPAPTPAQPANAPAVAPLRRPVTLELKDVPLQEALREIDRAADLGLAFTNEVVPANKKVSLSAKGMPAIDALKHVLQNTGVIVRETTSGQLILVKDVRAVVPTTADSNGFAAILVHVTDSATQKELAGAVVAVKGTKLSATTLELGYGVLMHVPTGLHTVTVRFLGYTPVEYTTVVPDTGYVRLDVALRMGMTRLQEVVTTATGQQRRYELANDITKLDADSIVRTQPISTVTQLLEGRVPGLVVEHTSGAPGDPSRLRLRGTSSMLKNNDPIVIVDGVRVYAAQSDSTSVNLASGRSSAGQITGGDNPYYTSAPSPLDQIDPHAIQTIEVLKGPSAATLYGPDAANGVIVITMKKGQSGPARWSASATRGVTYIPGKYPVGLYRWGTDRGTQLPVICPLQTFSCSVDSLVSFQALNDDRYTILDHGGNSNLSLGLSGGSEALTYAISGSYGKDEGVLKLPAVEVQRFESEHGGEPDSWMLRPQQLDQWSANSRLTAKLGAKADASLTTMLTHQTQQRSTLESDISTLMTTFIDAKSGQYYRADNTTLDRTDVLLPEFYTRTTEGATNFTNGANVGWRPLSWLTTSADAGINIINRQDDELTPRGLEPNADSIGFLHTAAASTVVSSVNLRATATAPLPWGFHLQLSTGANYNRTQQSAVEAGVSGLAPGTSSVNGAERITYATQLATDLTSFGWYLASDFTHDRFTISTGFRIDGSSTFGSNISVPVFPKLGISYLISQEPWFPIKHFFDVFRVRAAYGRAGVWPGPTDQLRLYRNSRPFEDGGFVGVTQVSTIGNSQIRPERSDEMEGGFDADFLDSRMSIGFSGYRKMRFDALESVPIAPSVYGGAVVQLQNIGTVRNTGVEATVTAQIVRSDPVTWSASLNFSRNHNLVTALGKGVRPFGYDYQRVVAGYPLFGRWGRPILGYSDVDRNGIITQDEVQLGDSLVFLGGSEPKYEAGLFSTLSLFRGAITVSGGFAYQNGMTQINSAVGSAASQVIFSPGSSDPHSSFAEQAAIAVAGATPYGIMQTVSTLRFNSLSVAYNFSQNGAARLGARSLSVALQGTNLGLFTNYRGKDPGVNAYSSGNNTLDSGVLPQPRTWQITVNATY